MKVDRDNLFKNIWPGLVLSCLFASDAIAISVEPSKFEDVKVASIVATDILREDANRTEKKSPYVSTDASPQQKNFALVDSIKQNGQFFFEMRSGHSLASESSAAALLILGFLGFFSRRWS